MYQFELVRHSKITQLAVHPEAEAALRFSDALPMCTDHLLIPDSLNPLNALGAIYGVLEPQLSEQDDRTVYTFLMFSPIWLIRLVQKTTPDETIHYLALKQNPNKETTVNSVTTYIEKNAWLSAITILMNQVQATERFACLELVEKIPTHIAENLSGGTRNVKRQIIQALNVKRSTISEQKKARKNHKIDQIQREQIER